MLASSTTSEPQASPSCCLVRNCSNGDLLIQLVGVSDSLLSELLALLCSHDARQIHSLKAKNSTNGGVLELVVLLAFVLEYCRAMEKSRLYIQQQENSSTGHVLNLQQFVAQPKFCFASGCNNACSLISCSLCCITTFCSEKCLSVAYEEHAAVCARAVECRRILGL